MLWPPGADPLAVVSPAPIGVLLGASLRLPPKPAAPPADGDLVEQLERLASLRDRGALDAEEYERAKKAVLDG